MKQVTLILLAIILITSGCKKSSNTMSGYSCTCIWVYRTRDTSVTYNYPGVSQDSAQSACSTLNAAYQASLGAGSADCRIDY